MQNYVLNVKGSYRFVIPDLQNICLELLFAVLRQFVTKLYCNLDICVHLLAHNICVYKIHFIHIFYSKDIAHVRSNSFKRWHIYFGEIPLFLVNPSSLIAGFKSNPQII